MKEERHIIGYEDSAEGKEIFYSINPSGKEAAAFQFHKATPGEVNLAVEKAAAAFVVYRKKSGVEKAAFLDAIADAIADSGEELIVTCMAETALPRARIEGERGRTVNQLRLFAALVREGSWVDARIETAMPDRTPAAKPDLRFMYIPLGPVAVFGAGNFPLAFSVAGGDTASALAAGCPVVVKAHPSHPATAAIVGRAVQTAARRSGMPDGVFSLLFDSGVEAGAQLVKHPLIKAVGFTGSYKGGMAIYQMAVSRPDPIPVYAEMGSFNPVFILPAAARERGEAIATAYAASVTMGVGQFCTNPGMIIFPQKASAFTEALRGAFTNAPGGVMLASYIHDAYTAGVQQRLAIKGIVSLAEGYVAANGESNLATPALLLGTAGLLQEHPALCEEIFGPAAVAVPVDNQEEMLAIAQQLPGQLTATVHGTAEELPAYRQLLDILEQKAGRLVINGFPTGVEVGSAMVHGGPFPATTDSRSTSVGTAAIYRFARPVCYQDMPQALLPAELQDHNPMAIARMMNGKKMM